ncbi:zinc finger BED domain-containing protein 4-like [Andrena cerasifolii]|uniref:zinc finger BED domain-containing protein 4-like n=1 Tax=Andrena cerasifolii TaxID=2819439 RepID=UPI004037AB87
MDNAANIVKAVKLCSEWERIPCFAHTLQPVVKDAIESCKDVTQLLKKCRGIVRFFHHSASTEQKLKKEQRKVSAQSKPLHLIRDVATRWNSQYDMMNRLLQVRLAVSAVLSDPRLPENLTGTEWSKMKYYCHSLEMFKEATLFTTVDQAPTLSRYIPTVHMLKKMLINLSQQQGSNPAKDLQTSCYWA